MERRPAVFFDFDGTLFFGTPALNTWCFNRALAEMGLPPAEKEKVDLTVGMTWNDLTAFIAGTDDPARLERFRSLLKKAVPEYVATEVRPIPGERTLLLSLREKANLAICSNAAPHYLLGLLDGLGIRDCFDEICWHRDGSTKESTIRELLDCFRPSYAVFAGDRLEDVLAAHAAGIPIAGIRNIAFPAETDGADTVSASLEELFAQIHRMIDNR